MPRTIRLVAAAIGLSAIIAACTSGATPAPASPSPAASAAASASPAASAAASASAAVGGGSVSLADSSLGKILVGPDGRTLYIFTNDTGGTPSCYDACATKWPPLTVAVTPGTGLDAEDFKTVARTDGTMQVTFYGQPLYYFASDTNAGDTNGQGFSDKWWVVGADGAPIKTK